MTAPARFVRFTKMSGAGNDFVVLEADEAARIDDFEAWVRAVCRRGLSVGADGVLIVGPVDDRRVQVRFHNPDGGEAFCGNGTRCAARFAWMREWCGPEARLLTRAGEIDAEILDDRVRLHLPPPVDHGRITLHAEGLDLVGRHVIAGVPHFVVPTPDLANAPIAQLGPAFRRHPHFGSEGTNVDLVAWRRDGSLGIRTWERGVEGETLSCGSGAVASAYAAMLDGAGGEVRVTPWSGIPLKVSFRGPAQAPFTAILEGDARVVFQATLSPEATRGIPG